MRQNKKSYIFLFPLPVSTSQFLLELTGAMQCYDAALTTQLRGCHVFAQGMRTPVRTCAHAYALARVQAYVRQSARDYVPARVRACVGIKQNCILLFDSYYAPTVSTSVFFCSQNLR